MSVQAINRALRSRRLRRGIALAALIAAQHFDPSVATAVTRSWVGPVGGDWNTALSWGPAGVPVAGDTALINSLSATTVIFSTNDYTAGELGDLSISSSSSLINNTVQQTGGAMNASGESIGTSGAARYIQTGGKNTMYALSMATSSGSTATYQLSGGSLNFNLMNLGHSGAGSFLQSGGTATNLDSVSLGYSNSGSGYYGLSAGTLIGAYENIGFNGSGTFVQSGGYHKASSEALGYFSPATGVYNLGRGSNAVSRLFVGYLTGATGTFTLSGSGSLIVASQFADESYMTLGDLGGSGIFTQTGGAGSISTCLYLGKIAGGSGRYDLSAGIMNIGSILYVGYGGNGTFSLSGTGSLNAAGGIAVGQQGSGTVNLSSGSLTVGGFEYVGTEGTASFAQTGGTHTVSNFFAIAAASGSRGTYELSGGVLTINGFERVGDGGLGTFVHSGGVHTIGSPSAAGELSIGNTGTGLYQLGGTGALTLYGNEFIGNGTFLQSGGTHTIGDAAKAAALIVGNDFGATGIYTMSAGVLSVSADEQIGNHGTGIFNQSGGVHTIGLPSAPTYLNLGLGAPGIVNVSGTASLTVNGTAFIGLSDDGTLNINGGAVTVTGALLIVNRPGARVNLSGGALTAAILSVDSNPLNFNWTGGSLNITTSLSTGPTSGIGAAPVLDFNKRLTVGNTLSIDPGSVLTLQGGSLVAGSLNTSATPSRFNWVSGGLSITGFGGLNIGGAGPLGSTVVINSGKSLNVTNTATVASGALLAIDDQGSVAAGAISNSGQIQLTNLTAQLSGGLLTNSGIISGAGRIANNLTNTSSGIVRASGSDWLQLAGTSNTNSGQINLINGGAIEFMHAMTNTASGVISGRGYFSVGDAGLVNNGNLAHSAGITDYHGDVANNSGAHITISGQANVTFWDDVTNNAGASIKVSQGSTATFFGTYAGGGITGGGNVYFESDISPGFSPAAIGIDGNVNFGQQSKLRIELAGKTRGTQYDAVDISGVTSLDGKVSVSTLSGFAPLPGDAFNILSFASRNGDVTVEAQTPFAGLRFQKVYSATSLQLLASALHDGDANLDGLVDIRDLYALASHYNASGQIWTGGDFTHDGLVNAVDLGILASHWQAGVGAGPGTNGTALSRLGLPMVAVPEPASAAMVLMSGAVLLRRRRA